jgi:hypothetical protein
MGIIKTDSNQPGDRCAGTESTMLHAAVKSVGIEGLSEAHTAFPSPTDPTRTSEPLPAPPRGSTDEQPPTMVPQLRNPERYRVLGEHGRGGLGRVSRAHDRELGRDVAVK